MALLDLAVIGGVGKSAEIEDIGFFKSTKDFTPAGAFSGLPDYYYIRPKVNWKKYKKIIIPNFTSITKNVGNIRSLQVREFKNIKRDIPDQIALSLDGNIFPNCSWINKTINHKSRGSINNLQADAVLFGNISEFKTGSRDERGNMATTTQVEIKLVDRKTGQELIKMTNRSLTDSDKIAMPIVRLFSNLMKKAKE